MVEKSIRNGFAAVYAVGYLVLTIATITAESETTFMVLGLVSMGMLLFAMALLSFAENPSQTTSSMDVSLARSAIVPLMVFGYVLHIGLFLRFEVLKSFSPTIEYFRLEPAVLTAAVTWWAVGQIGFWWIYFGRLRNRLS